MISDVRATQAHHSVLRRLSQHHKIKLRDVAQQFRTEHERP
ncbi:hypothetical protein [Streptomyces sp. NPDC057315]